MKWLTFALFILLTSCGTERSMDTVLRKDSTFVDYRIVNVPCQSIAIDTAGTVLMLWHYDNWSSKIKDRQRVFRLRDYKELLCK
jgi:hypothetical protein